MAGRTTATRAIRTNRCSSSTNRLVLKVFNRSDAVTHGAT